MGKSLGNHKLYIKHDSLAGAQTKQGKTLFGGNKVRKLEFLLADALTQNAPSVITCGGVGSNHAAATAAYAKHLGLQCYTILFEQPNSNTVLRNLSLMHGYNAHMILLPNSLRMQNEIDIITSKHKKNGQHPPYIIPMGGSTALGSLGIVNAALELKQQIDQGKMPSPDIIYLPFGTMGTTAGLALGLKTVGLKTKIIAVRVGAKPTYDKAQKHFKEINKLLQSYDPTFPTYTMDNVTVRHEFFGGAYGHFTPESINAMKVLKDTEGITLDGTYSGKAMAALLSDAKQHKLDNKVVLFWNTYDGSKPDIKVAPASLKSCFKKYFTQPAQGTTPSK